MKKSIAISILFVLISAALNAQSTTIAVLPFTGLAQGQANLLAGMLGTELRNSGNYQIAPRTPAITAAFREQTVQRSGLTDTHTISELGKGANAQYAVSAHVQQIGDKKLISASIIDVESFQQISGDYFEYSIEKEVVEYMPILAKMLLTGMGKNRSNLKTLAMFPLTSEGEATEGERDVLAQMLSIELANSGKYAVVVRTSSLSNVMRELKIQREGFTDEATIIEIGQAINADYVLYGEVTKFGAESYISTYIVDVAKKTQDIGAYDSYDKVENIVALIPELTYKLAKVSKKDFYLNKANILTDVRAGQNGISNIKTLLQTGNLNAKDNYNYGYTALIYASSDGHTEIAKALIAAGAYVNAKNNYSYTALMLASSDGHTEIAKALIAAKADVNAKGNHSYTALILASSDGHTETAKALIAAGADVNAKDKYGDTALYRAENRKHTETANYLKSVGGKK